VILAVVAAVVVTLMLDSGPAAGGPAAVQGIAGGSRAGVPAGTGQAQPVITRAQAQQVLARYIAVNNQANKVRSNSLLAGIEGGSSYQIDTGQYRWTRVSDPANRSYLAYGVQDVAYYIPRLPAAYPKWFAVRTENVDRGVPAGKAAADAFTEYTVFSQASAGAPWLDVYEPFIVKNVVMPTIATDPQGYAIATNLTGDAAGLSVAPDRIGQLTATYLNQVAVNPSNQAVMAAAPYLSDLSDEVYWRSGEDPGHVIFDATDTHSPTRYPVFGLRTKNGGALLFYTTAAQLTLAPPASDHAASFDLGIPGYYSTSQTLTSPARMGYTEQFATYDPPAGVGDRRIVGEVSSITSRD
jgi:hypothetical protein